MAVDVRDRTPVQRRFSHEAAFYRGTADLLDLLVPYICEGLASDEQVLVALLPDRLGPLRDALGSDADAVQMVDMAELGRNPARIIPAWHQFVSESAPRGGFRGVGEPIWSGRRTAEITECRLHEALLNVAFDDGPAWRLLCPYDAAALPQDVVADAMRTHPVIASGADRRTGYEGHRHAYDEFTEPLPVPPSGSERFLFGAGDLAGLRDVVGRLAAHAGLDRDRADDLVLAAHELATNSVRHGGGGGEMSAWLDPDAFVVDIRDRGTIDDVLVGRSLADGLPESGRGVWMANQLCDLVQVRSAAGGTQVRLTAWR